ncbi:MAG: flippase-like domain-containing protein [Chloroflexi bacterium]|nr:flippase-like domain-containing protein [Chloroflexota bacterium]
MASRGPSEGHEWRDRPILIPVLSYIGRHRRLFAIQAPVAAVLLAVLIWRVDVLEGLRNLPDVRPGWILAGMVTFTLSKAIHAYRWRVFLQHREAPLAPLLGIFLASNLANALIPFRAGDLLRIELPSRLLKLPRAELVSSVLIVETIFDGLAFVLLLLAAVALFGDLVVALPAVVFFAVLVVLVFLGLSWLARLGVPEDPEGSALLRWLPERWRGRGARFTRQFIEGMSSLRDLRRIAGALVVSIVAWLAEVGVYWMLGRAFGFELDAGEAIVLMIAANLIVSLPLTPWDVGPYEIAVTEAFVLLGGDRVDASTYAVGSHLVLLVWITISGAVAMLALSLRPGEVLRSGRPPSDEPPRDEPD